MKLNAIYTEILKSVGFNADDEGLVSRKNASGKNMPVTLADEDGTRLRLALPTDERLRSGNWKGLTAFHPLSENIVRGESEVISLLRTAMLSRIVTVTSMLMQNLMVIAVDKDRHKELSPVQHTLTAALSKADATSANNLTKVMEKINSKSRTVARLFLKRGGVINDENYDRAFILSFPLDIKEDRSWYGVDLRIKDVKIYKALMEFILPGYDTQDWCVGSNSKQAPYLMAALSGYSKVMTRLNDVFKMFEERIEYPEETFTPLDWVSELPTLLEHINDIPPLRGNTGNVGVNETEEAQDTTQVVKPVRPNIEETQIEMVAKPAQPAPAATQTIHRTAAGAPVNQAVPDQGNSGKVDMSKIVAPVNQPAQHPPQQVYTHQPMTTTAPGTVPHYTPQATAQPQMAYDIYGNPVPQQPATTYAAPQHHTTAYAAPQQPAVDMYGRPLQQQPPQQQSFMPAPQQTFMPQQAPAMSAREASDARAQHNRAIQQQVHYTYR